MRHYFYPTGILRHGLNCGLISVTQAEREQSLKGFSLGTVRVLVATDVASRGLDIKGIGHVVNMDLPKTFEDYVHRIGEDFIFVRFIRTRYTSLISLRGGLSTLVVRGRGFLASISSLLFFLLSSSWLTVTYTLDQAVRGVLGLEAGRRPSGQTAIRSW